MNKIAVFTVSTMCSMLACGPANHSMKVGGIQEAVQKRDSCSTQSDCDKLKADAKDLLEECKKMVTSGFWARTNCDTEEGIVKDVEKKEYANFLRSSLMERCGKSVDACLELYGTSGRFEDDSTKEYSCSAGCTAHNDPILCKCAAERGRQIAFSVCMTRDCRQLYIACIGSKGRFVTREDEADCAQQGRLCQQSCQK